MGAYFEEVSKEYQGWATTIEALEGELGDQPVADGPPLQGISFETKGSAAGDILIEVGDVGTPYEVIALTGLRSFAPLILFRGSKLTSRSVQKTAHQR